MSTAASAASESLRTLRLVESALRERYPDGILPHPLAGHPGAPAGVIVRHGDALTLIGVDLRGEGSGEWSLFATCVLAVAGERIDDGLEWVNARNAGWGWASTTARIRARPASAPSPTTRGFRAPAFLACIDARPDEPAARLATVLLAMVANVVDTGAAEAKEARRRDRRAPLGDSQTDAQTLLVHRLGVRSPP